MMCSQDARIHRRILHSHRNNLFGLMVVYYQQGAYVSPTVRQSFATAQSSRDRVSSWMNNCPLNSGSRMSSEWSQVSSPVSSVPSSERTICVFCVERRSEVTRAHMRSSRNFSGSSASSGQTYQSSSGWSSPFTPITHSSSGPVPSGSSGSDSGRYFLPHPIDDHDKFYTSSSSIGTQFNGH